MPNDTIKCSVCKTVYGRGRPRCPACYGVECYECHHPIYRSEDWHRNAHGNLHGRCVEGPREPEPVQPEEKHEVIPFLAIPAVEHLGVA